MTNTLEKKIKSLKKKNFKNKVTDTEIEIKSDTKLTDTSYENVIFKGADIINLKIHNCMFLGCRIHLKNVKNLSVTNNIMTLPFLVDNDPNYVNSKGEQAKYARGIELIECDIIKIENNELFGCIGEAIYIENIKKNQYNIVKNNLVELSSVDEVDTNLEASIFVRNSKDGYVTITENTIRYNLPNSNQTNRCDGIEVNLNRAKDYAGDDGFIDDVAGPSDVPVTLYANITKNNILSLNGSADGIDINVGNNGILNLNILENTVSDVGDEGLTLDSYGPNVTINGNIENNYFSTTGSKGARKDKDGKYDEDGSTDGMAFTLSELIDGTTMKNDTINLIYDFVIRNNTFVADSENLAGTNERPDKAEGIKIAVGEKIDSEKGGLITFNGTIVNNIVKTRAGPGFKVVFLEKAKNVTLLPNLKISDNEFQKFNNADEHGKPYTKLKDIGEVVFLEESINSKVLDGIVKVNRNKFHDMKNSYSKVAIMNESDPENVKSLKVKYNDNEGATLDSNI